MTEHRVLIHTGEATLRKAIRVYIWRRHFRRPRTAAAWLVMLVVAPVTVASDGPTFLSGAISTAVFMAILFFVALWRAQVVATVSRYRRMDPPEVELTLRHSGITLSSSLNAVTIPWSQFTETWFLPEFWMLFTAPSQFISIPTGSIPPDSLAFLRAHLPGRHQPPDR